MDVTKSVSEISSDFSWKRVIALSGNRWKTLVFIIITIIVQSLLSPVTPLLVAEIIDKGFSGTNTIPFEVLLTLLFFAGITQVMIHTAQDMLVISLTSGIIYNVRLKLYDHLQQKSIRFFTDNKSGEIISRVTSEANMIGDSVFKPIIYSFQTILSLIVTIVTMIMLSWKISLIIILTTPLLLLTLPLMGKIVYKISKKLVENNAEINSFINENLSINGIMLLKLFGRNDVVREKFINLIDTVRKLSIKQAFLGGIFNTTFTLGTAIAPVLMYWLGRPGGPFEISAGTAIALSSYIASLFNPIQSISKIGIMLQSAKVTFERLFSYLDQNSDVIEPKNNIPLGHVKGEICFDNVSFLYDEEKALDNLSFKVQAKEKVSIVGYSGSGKTTIAYLLSRLYQPTKGDIYIDSVNLKDVSSEDIPKHIGLISQEVYLLHSTIRENILLAKPDATEEEMVMAAQSAHIHEKIMSLPDQYDTLVGERGYKLSGGEKQRIAIARVFLQNPSILILDEATSSLDTHFEEMIQNAIERLTYERTVISITHRVANISNNNRVIVLSNGKIAESGFPEELLQNQSIFAQLCKQSHSGHTKAVKAFT
ncbi:ABC transporter ATP-binding protein [Priestia megaterium]|uniref:ABC transporter ATP-binding protein n=1 Tax=Priestia megaterium TaxID=1404 RepID=UPI00366DAC45